MNSVFSLAGERLLEYFRGELVPGALSSPDMLQLAYPGMDGEFRLGLCLHELEEIHPHGPPGMTRLSEDSRRFPDLLLALRFLAFANRKAAFGSMEAADELLLLEGTLRAVRSCPGLELEGHRLKLTLQPLTLGEKSSLWQSLNAPLQPAAYFTLEPVALPASRIRRVPSVREVRTSAGYMEKRGGDA